MSTSVGEIDLSLILNNQSFSKSLNSVKEQANSVSNKMSSSLKRLGSAVVAAFSVAAVKNFGQQCIESAAIQTEAETKLTTVMRQRMNASEKAVKGVKSYASALQEVGVVGDEVQLTGAQQLSTFLKTDEALKSLMPAMNNLAVQQNGVNVSSESMVNIGNLMGKVMQGQTSALTRVGITFNEAQEKVLKYGNEQERAAMLAQVITNNVGDMNKAIASTPAGQLTIRVINVDAELNGKRIKVVMKQSYSKGLLFPSDTVLPETELHCGYQVGTIEVHLFCGTVNSSIRQKNRAVKEIIAYDDLYLASQKYAYNYFTSLAIYSPKISLYDLRVYLCGSFLNDYDYENEFTGFNDSNKLSLKLDLVKSVFNDKTTIADLLSAYCELNACFAIMSGEGKIKFIQILNPKTEVVDNYSNLDFEEYTTRSINLIKFKYNNDSYFSYGHTEEEKQSWYISDNIITACCTDIAGIVTSFNNNKGNNYIFGDLYAYRPFKADVYGRWWLECGDKVNIKTGFTDTETVDSFILERTLKGTNGMRVKLTAEGTEYLGKDEINELQQN